MKKQILILLPLFALSFLFIACNSDDTYADKLKKESKSIDRFIKNNDIKVLKDFPSDSVFAENEYFLHSSGAYIRIIKYGDKSRMATQDPVTEVYMRAYGYFLNDPSTIYTNFGQSNSGQWIGFTYGKSDTYVGSYSNISSEYYKYMLMSVSCTLPLEYVGDGAEVSLIVPFLNGSTQQQTVYQAIYFSLIKYTIN